MMKQKIYKIVTEKVSLKFEEFIGHDTLNKHGVDGNLI